MNMSQNIDTDGGGVREMQIVNPKWEYIQVSLIPQTLELIKSTILTAPGYRQRAPRRRDHAHSTRNGQMEGEGER